MFFAGPVEQKEAQAGTSLGGQVQEFGHVLQGPLPGGPAVGGVDGDQVVPRSKPVIAQKLDGLALFLGGEHHAGLFALPSDAQHFEQAGLGHGRIAHVLDPPVGIKPAVVPGRGICEAHLGPGKGSNPAAAR